MRLLFIAPLAESVPPRLYGGTERVVSWLVEELVARGHDVTLFASGDSRTRATLVPCVPEALRLAGVVDFAPHHLMEVADAIRRSGEFDLVHSHVDYVAFPFAAFADAPIVHTLHGRLDLPWLPEVYRRHPDLELVSISDAQREPLPGVRFVATVHHGLPRDLFRFHPRAEDYVLFLGRTSVEKGPVAAIRAAREAGVRLKIAAKIDPADRAYFEREIAPLLDPPRVEYVGEIDDAEKDELLGGARALLLPIDWPEPFGLSFIESMACGTPVITRARGSVPEIVRPGLSGWIADSHADLVGAIRSIDRIERAACRAEFERRFTVERMADDYEDVYRRVVSRAAAAVRREEVAGAP